MTLPLGRRRLAPYYVLRQVTFPAIWNRRSRPCIKENSVTLCNCGMCFLFDPYVGPYQVLPLRTKSRPGSNGNEGVLQISKSFRITGVSSSDCLMPYPRHSLGISLLLCRDAVSVFYSPSRPGHTGWRSYSSGVGVFYSPSRLSYIREVLPLCRDAVSVFYSPSRPGHTGWRSYSSGVGVFYSPSRLSYIREVLPLCRDAVSVFYSSSLLGHVEWGSYRSAKMQWVYSTAPADRTTFGGES